MSDLLILLGGVGARPGRATAVTGDDAWGTGAQATRPVRVLPEAVRGAADIHDAAEMDEPVDEGGGQTSSPKISPHFSTPVLLVRIVEACSERRAMSWKKSIAPVRLIGT